jgi:hypothetical protein
MPGCRINATFQYQTMRIGGAQCAPPPSQTGRADLPHPAFQSAAVDGLAQVDVPRCSEGTRQPRSPHGPAHPVTGGPLPADSPQPSGFPPPRRAQPCGTTSDLVSWPQFGSQHYLPTSLRSTIITRFFATTDALTPTGPLVHRQPWFPDSPHPNFPPFYLQPSAVLDQTRSTPSTLAALFCSGFAVRSQARQNR